MGNKDFHHPYKPYDIQQQLMTAIYQCIEEGKVGVFESPTGTGKSLSLICASTTWLREFGRRKLDENLHTDETTEDDPAWVIEAVRAEKRRAALRTRQEWNERLARVRQKERHMQEKYERGGSMSKRIKLDHQPDRKEPREEAQFELEDYHSDQEAKGKGVSSANNLGLSAETQALMKKVGMCPEPIEDNVDVDEEIKIIFCSRTHSQLSQFAAELRKVRMPSSFHLQPPASPKEVPIEEGVAEELRHLSLGSRRNLCINPKVRNLPTATAINERCLELQKPGLSGDCKCPHMPTKEDGAAVNEFRDIALAKIRDIEDLATVGKQLGICPYYASRSAIKSSEIVTLPYQLLLQKSSREALDLSVKDHVIIIDEAHNLMDAILALHSSSVTLSQLARGRMQVMTYLEKFRNRLKGKNRVYVAQIIRLIDSLISFLQTKNNESDSANGAAALSDLLAGKGVDQINVFKLAAYLQQSKLARKIDGYTEFKAAGGQQHLSNGTKKQRIPDEVPLLTHIQGFIITLMNPSAEGRFFFSRSENDICLRYMLLDPTAHFQELVNDARAVILCGGTMSPMEDYINHLFSYVPATRLMTMSCGHVIPEANLVAWPVTRDLSNQELDFTFERRNEMIVRAGCILKQLIQVIPNGVVAFFPSYAFLGNCVDVWKKQSTSNKPKAATIWRSLTALKPVFVESPKSKTSTTAGPTATATARTAEANDNILSAYSNAISDPNNSQGALLLSVIGGSLSEGINFSDKLGRGVIVFGLPFPNPHTPEWKARSQYLTEKTVKAKLAAGSSKREAEAAGKAAASEFYTNTAMRAVNQAIGRAIRHKNDYAAILVLDRRYGTSRIREKLPGWIKGSLKPPESISGIKEGLTKFFAHHEGKHQD